jgi:hypothetical protein
MAEHLVRHHIVSKDTVLPPPPPGVRYVPAPFLGIVIADDDLRAYVDHKFHWPMILLALAVLPLLLFELLLMSRGEMGDIVREFSHGWHGIAVKIGFSIIWFAFVVEFAIKIAIAESRFEYVKRNWLDLIIILLPALRVLRLARAGSSLVRTSRVFKLRGVGMKLVRYGITFFVGMEATDRLLRRFGISLRTKFPDPGHMTRFQLTKELRWRRRQVIAWEQWYDQYREYLDHHAPQPADLPDRPAESENLAAEAPTQSTVDSSTRDAALAPLPAVRPAHGTSD